jgi:hypothetical protein
MKGMIHANIQTGNVNYPQSRIESFSDDKRMVSDSFEERVEVSHAKTNFVARDTTARLPLEPAFASVRLYI